VLVVLSGQGGDGGEGWSSVTAGTVSDRCEWTFILKRYAEWTCVNDRGDFGPCHGQVVQGKSKTKDQIVIQATTINADGSRGAKPSSESLEVSSLIRAAAASRSAALAGGWKEPGLCQVIGTVGGRLSLPMNQGSSSGPGVATLNYRQVAKFEGGVPSVMRVAPSDLDARIALLKLEPPEPAKADCFAVMEIFADGRVTLSSPFGSCGDVDGVERADAGWSIRIRPEKAKVMEIWQYEAGSAKRTAGQGP